MAASTTVIASTLWRTCMRPARGERDAAGTVAVSMSVTRAPSRNEGAVKNRNAVETLSMLDSRGMAAARRVVLVTRVEYQKAEAVFQAEASRQCEPAPDEESDLAAAVRARRASHVVVGSRRYAGALYDALPAGAVIARFGVGHDGIDKARATAAGLLCTNTPGVLNQSVA